MKTKGHIGTISAVIVALAVLGGCSKPHDTVLPQDVSKFESIKPKLEKLTPEERELLAGYVMRRSLAAALPGLAGSGAQAGIPPGVTVGQAIDEQRTWKADQAMAEARRKAEEAKLKAEHEAAVKAMQEAVSVALVDKKLDTKHGMSGIVMDERLVITLRYKNNTAKDISGVKGRVVIRDQFGDELTAFQISNDDTIKAGESYSWVGGRSVKYGLNAEKDRKLANLAEDKFKLSWEPQMIAFVDGSTMKAPGK